MRRGLHATVLVGATVAMSGCFGSRAGGPGVFGVDLRAAPGISVGSRSTVHPTAAYARSIFGGGAEGASTATVHAGGQFRFALARSETGAGGFWVGAEGGYASQRKTFDSSSGLDDLTSDGWTAAALIGFPLVEGGVGTLHYYLAAGLSHYDRTGPYGRVGLDVQLAFLGGR